MKRSLWVLGLIVTLITVSITAQPADDAPTWRAWLFDRESQLIMVDGNRNILRELTLPLPAEDLTILSIIVAPDGETISYVFRGAIGDDRRVYRRDVWNTRTGNVITVEERRADPGLNRHAVFDPTGRYLVYADAVTHAINVLDLRNNITPFVLDVANSDVLPTDMLEDPHIVPTVMRFDGARVWFHFGYDTERAGLTDENGRSYVWHIRTGILTASAAYPAPYTATFAPTGETLTVIRGFDRTSSVHIYDPVYGARWLYFENALFPTSVDGVAFVQNGERVLYQSIGSIRTLGVSDLLLGRDGTIDRVLRPIRRSSVHATADGFIYMLRGADGRSELVHVDTRRPLSDRVIWQGEGLWTIIWADPGTRTLPAYEPWAVLGEPIITDAPIPTLSAAAPTALPTPAPLLYPGREVRVITNGDVLYLRDSAGTGGDILMFLYDDDRVTLLQGPVTADGFTWWQVETEDGTIGWAAEASGEVSTLLPLESAIPTVTPEAYGEM